MIGTIAVAVILTAIAGSILFVQIKNKRKGKSSCGCGCSSCGMAGCCGKSGTKIEK